VLHGLLVVCVWLFEPEKALDFLGRPETVCNTAHESKSGCPWSSLSISDDLLHEAFIFRRFPIVQRGILNDLSAREPDEGLWPQQASGKIIINFIGEAIRKYLVEVLRDVRGGRMVGMIVGVSMASGSRDCQG